jgi:hypothetical protein
VKVSVTAANRGGLLVQFPAGTRRHMGACAQGFIPISHLGQVQKAAFPLGGGGVAGRSDQPRPMRRPIRQHPRPLLAQLHTPSTHINPTHPIPPHTHQPINADNMGEYVGQEIPAKFLEVDQEAGRLVFSHRRAARTPRMRSDTVRALPIRGKVYGTVRRVEDDGAYVDVEGDAGGSAGFVPLSEFSLGGLTPVRPRRLGPGAWAAPANNRVLAAAHRLAPHAALTSPRSPWRPCGRG